MRALEVPHGEPVPGTGDVHLLRRRLESLLGIPATDGNRVRVLRNGDEIFPPMLEAIRSARSTVDFLTFIYWKGEPAQKFAGALRPGAGRAAGPCARRRGGRPADGRARCWRRCVTPACRWSGTASPGWSRRSSRTTAPTARC